MNNIIRKIKHGFQFIFDNKYRFFILRDIGFFDNMPDELYLKKVFLYKLGYPLNLQNPQTFNEKLQWLKLHDRKPEYTTMVDKYEVKKYVADKIGEQYIIPTLGVWNSFDEIDFDSLPNQFVLKCTHDSGGLVICRDKSSFDIEAARKIINKSLSVNYYYAGREWPYKNVKPRIIAEQYMEDGEHLVPEDYKIYCFNGNPKYIVVFHNRFDNRKALSETVYNINWEPQHISLDEHFAISDKTSPKPECLEELLEITRILCKNISQVRVDFYILNNKIYFGEITLYTANGLQKMIPEELDAILGNWIKLPIDKKNKEQDKI